MFCLSNSVGEYLEETTIFNYTSFEVGTTKFMEIVGFYFLKYSLPNYGGLLFGGKYGNLINKTKKEKKHVQPLRSNAQITWSCKHYAECTRISISVEQCQLSLKWGAMCNFGNTSMYLYFKISLLSLLFLPLPTFLQLTMKGMFTSEFGSYSSSI